MLADLAQLLCRHCWKSHRLHTHQLGSGGTRQLQVEAHTQTLKHGAPHDGYKLLKPGAQFPLSRHYHLSRRVAVIMMYAIAILAAIHIL